MKISPARLTPLLVATAAAAAILTAPAAMAAQSCDGTGGGTVCQSPGNVQIDDATAPAQFFPYGGDAFVLGGGLVGGAGFHAPTGLRGAGHH
jgi:uncharacterized protein with LGFP repeats